MPRPRRPNRSTITDTTLTLRLTQDDRDVLDCLVEHQHEAATAQGFAMEPTVASYIRGLIRREAQKLGVEAQRNAAGHVVCEKKRSA